MTGANDEDLEFLWRDYEQSNNGIAAYDEHLFKIRSWHITTSAALIAAFFGLSDSAKMMAKTPGVALFIMLTTSSMFWWLDGFNKSLQMVHIFNSQDVEREIRSIRCDLNYTRLRFYPTRSLRFNKKNKRHIRPTIKNLLDESIYPFYVGSMFISFIVVFAKSDWVGCFYGLGAGCHLSADSAMGGLALLIPAILVTLSALWGLEPGKADRLRYVLQKNKKSKVARIKKLKKALFKAGFSEEQLEPQYYLLFRANFETERFVIFVDGRYRERDLAYLRERADFVRSIGKQVISVRTCGHPVWVPTEDHLRSDAAESEYGRIFAACTNNADVSVRALRKSDSAGKNAPFEGDRTGASGRPWGSPRYTDNCPHCAPAHGRVRST